MLRLGGIGPISVHWDYIPVLRYTWVKYVGVSQMFRVGPVSAVRQQAGTECLVVLSIADSETVRLSVKITITKCEVDLVGVLGGAPDSLRWLAPPGPRLGSGTRGARGTSGVPIKADNKKGGAT